MYKYSLVAICAHKHTSHLQDSKRFPLSGPGISILRALGSYPSCVYAHEGQLQNKNAAFHLSPFRN